jgi:hypothetical protein
MRKCPYCNGRKFWQFSTGHKRCSRCGLTRKFSQSRWTKARIPSYWKGRLVEFFCLGVAAYRLRFQMPVHQDIVITPMIGMRMLRSECGAIPSPSRSTRANQKAGAISTVSKASGPMQRPGCTLTVESPGNTSISNSKRSNGGSTTRDQNLVLLLRKLLSQRVVIEPI